MVPPKSLFSLLSGLYLGLLSAGRIFLEAMIFQLFCLCLFLLFRQCTANPDDVLEPYCRGRVPKTGWPPSAGSMPWLRYPSLMALCVGGGHGIQGLMAPFSLNCECRLTAAGAHSLVCTAPSHWGAGNTLKLIETCMNKCRCPGDLRPIEPDPPDPVPTKSVQIKEPDGDTMPDSSYGSQSAGTTQCYLEQTLEDLLGCTEDTSNIREWCATPSCTGYSGCALSRQKGGCRSQLCVSSSVWKKAPPFTGTCLTRQMLRTVSEWARKSSLRNAQLSLGLGGRKRSAVQEFDEEDVRCLCNGTYESRDCCWAEDGQVWLS